MEKRKCQEDDACMDESAHSLVPLSQVLMILSCPHESYGTRPKRLCPRLSVQLPETRVMAGHGVGLLMLGVLSLDIWLELKTQAISSSQVRSRVLLGRPRATEGHCFYLGHQFSQSPLKVSLESARSDRKV